MRLSVIVPVLDDAAALRNCLAALAAQRRPIDEVLVMDNGCTDGSAAVAAGAGARVIVEPRRGILSAAAAGFDAATGDVLLRCDADSRPHPHWAGVLAGRLAADPTLDAVTGPGEFTDLPGVRGRAAWALYAAGYFGGMGAAGANLPLWGSNMALRAASWRRVSARVHRTDSRVHDDLDISLALGPRARIAWESRARMPVQGRAFDSPAAFARRVGMGRHTLGLNWADDGPGERWLDRLGIRRSTATGR